MRVRNPHQAGLFPCLGLSDYIYCTRPINIRLEQILTGVICSGSPSETWAEYSLSQGVVASGCVRLIGLA